MHEANSKPELRKYFTAVMKNVSRGIGRTPVPRDFSAKKAKYRDAVTSNNKTMPWEVYERGAGYRDLALAFMSRERDDPWSPQNVQVKLHGYERK